MPGRRALQVLGGAENLEAEAVHDGTSQVLRGAENLMGPQSRVPRAASGGGGARLSTPERAAHFLGSPRACPAGAAAASGIFARGDLPLQITPLRADEGRA